MSRVRNPMISLQEATKISHPVSTLPDQADAPDKGMVRFVGCVRGSDPQASTLTLILTDVVRHDGFDHVVTTIRYKKVRLAQAAVDSVGGWAKLQRLNPTQRVSVFVADDAKESVPTCEQIRITDKF